MANSREAIEELDKVFAAATLDEWRERLAGFDGQWAVMQNTIETASDPQTIANGYVQDCRTAADISFRLAAAPVQFDGKPAVPHRAPELNEHGDSILEALGLRLGRHRGPQGPRRRGLNPVVPDLPEGEGLDPV